MWIVIFNLVIVYGSDGGMIWYSSMIVYWLIRCNRLTLPLLWRYIQHYLWNATLCVLWCRPGMLMWIWTLPLYLVPYLLLLYCLAEAYVWLTAVFPIFRTYMNSMVSIPTWYWAWYCSDIWSSMVMEAIVISSIVFSLPMESGRLVFRINGTYSMLDYNLTCTGLVGIKEVWNLVGNKCSISI
jgi:hypothetical protein